MAGRERGARGKILGAAYELFYRKGFGRVGVDLVAERAGVTKRTLYYHFASKDDLLAAVLEHYHEEALSRIRHWGDSLGEDPGDMIDQLFAGLARWATRPRWEGAGYTRLAMELADLPGHPARRIASLHKTAVEDWLAGALSRRGIGDAGEAARQIVLLVEGCSALMLIHGDRSYAASAARAARQSLGLQGRGRRPDVSAT